MARIDGAYDCVSKTPLGEQKSIFTIVSSGDSFHGTNASPLGALEVRDGVIDGNRLTWKMEMTLPMPMTLNCEGIVDGDTLTATVDTGAFGSFTMTGTRRS